MDPQLPEDLDSLVLSRIKVIMAKHFKEKDDYSINPKELALPMTRLYLQPHLIVSTLKLTTIST